MPKKSRTKSRSRSRSSSSRSRSRSKSGSRSRSSSGSGRARHLSSVYRSHPTRGWKQNKPTHRGDRRRLAEKFGAKQCFLKPDTLNYPICTANSTTGKPTCEGLLAAKQDAMRPNHTMSNGRRGSDLKVATRADAMALRLNCEWVKTKRRVGGRSEQSIEDDPREKELYMSSRADQYIQRLGTGYPNYRGGSA